MRLRKNGFTLVELLVVIGIIALLISILLPSLSKARKQATAVKCQSNMRQIGQAIVIYANLYNGEIVPSVVWSNTPNAGGNDAWGFLLVNDKLLPDPRLKYTAPNASASDGLGTVFLCPAVRDYLVGDNAGTHVTTAANASDGFDQRYGTVMLVSNTATFPPYFPDDPNNGVPGSAKGSCVIDFGYGINGCVNFNGAVNASWYTVPSTAIAYDGQQANCPPTKKLTTFKRSADTVIIFDGSEWNIMNPSPLTAAITPTTPQYTAAPLWRIAGSRHGNWNPNKPYNSGVTNLLFLDGHVEPANRADLPQENPNPGSGLPTTGANLTGPRNERVSSRYIWNTSQQY